MKYLSSEYLGWALGEKVMDQYPILLKKCLKFRKIFMYEKPGCLLNVENKN